LPFNIFGYIFLYQLILVIVYLSMVYGFVTYNLLYGVIIIVTLPYIFLIISNMGNKWIIIFSILLSLYFTLIGSRTAFGGLILFSLTYYLYPYLTRTNFIYNLFFIVCFFGFISLQFLYVQGAFYFVDDFMLQVFNKNIDSGRIDIWKNLSVYILEKPFFGYGSNQSSSYISSDFIVNSSNEPRSLSSHNMYLEILLRGGIFLLGIMSLIFYLIWKTFYSFDNFIYPRIAAAGLISFMFLAGGVEIGVTQNIIINSLAWGFWGMAAGNNLSDKS